MLREYTMNSENGTNKKWGRRQQDDQDDVSDPNLATKEKNRVAAQKCRKKREQLLNEMKQKNDELREENGMLCDQMKSLEHEWREYMKLINYHIKQGCKIPDGLITIWCREIENSSIEESSSGDSSTEVDAVENIESSQSSPDDVLSENLSQHFQNGDHAVTVSVSEGPTALFSGTPLSNAEMTRRRGKSTIKSSSSTPSSSQKISQPTDKLKDLSQFLVSNKLPKVFRKPEITMQKEFLENVACASNNSLHPAVVLQAHKNTPVSNKVIIYTGDSNMCSNNNSYRVVQLVPNQPNAYIQQRMDNQTLREPAIDVSGAEMYEKLTEQEISQLNSGFGMDAVVGFSYSEDVQQFEPVNGSNQYTNRNDQQVQNENILENIARNHSPSQSNSEILVRRQLHQHY